MRSVSGLVLALLLLAGCGSKTPTSSGSAASGPGAAAFAYARCMRGHGVIGFPDPKVSVSPGRTSVAMVAPASLTHAPHFKTAEHACNGILPGPGARPDHRGPGGTVLLAFARCLRSHGEANFPDPDRNGQISREMLLAAGINLHTPVFLSAGKACIGVTHGAITAADVRAAMSGAH